MKLKHFFSSVLVLCLMLSLCVSISADSDDPDNTPIPETTEIPASEASPEPDNSDDPDDSDHPVLPGITVPPVVSDDSDILQTPAGPDDLPVTGEPEVTGKDEDQTETVAAEDMINVVVPSAGEIIINPYRLKVAAYESKAQILHEPQKLDNYSEFPVTVDVMITGTVSQGSRAVFVSGQPAERTREVFLYVEFLNSDTGWSSAYNNATNQIIATLNGNSRSDVLTIAANGVGYFRLSGEMSTNVLWENTDTFGAILVYSFSAASESD